MGAEVFGRFGNEPGMIIRNARRAPRLAGYPRKEIGYEEIRY
jgi:hypothetical protein